MLPDNLGQLIRSGMDFLGRFNSHVIIKNPIQRTARANGRTEPPTRI